MKTSFLILGLALLTALSLKAAEREGEKSGASFSSPPAPVKNATSPASDSVRSLYEEAANTFVPYAEASPSARAKILTQGLPLLKGALEASDARLKRESTALNYRTVSKLDGRFSEARNEKELKDLIGSETNGFLFGSTLDYRDPKGADKRGPRAVSGSPVRVERPSPLDVAKAFGQAGVDAAEELAFENEVANLLETSVENGAQILALNEADSLSDRSRKITAQVLLDMVFGMVVSYEESFFAAAERTSGAIEVWEFKQPVSFKIKKTISDERTRLNTGTEVTITIDFTRNETTDLCRKYVNGFWSTWGDFPELGTITITKEKDWTATFRTELPFRRFLKLTESELEAALSKSGTTKRLSAIEQAGDLPAKPDDLLFLFSYKAGVEDYDWIIQAVRQLPEKTGNERLGVPLARRISTAAFECLAVQRSSVAESVKTGVGFSYYGRYEGANTENPEMFQSTPKHPKRGTKEHFYGEAYDLTPCILAFKLLTDAAPQDPDAFFDLALLESFSDALVKQDENMRRAAVGHLSKACELASKTPPASGRDFKKLITDSPTFISLQTEDSFGSLLVSLSGSPGIQASNQNRRFGNGAATRYDRKFGRERILFVSGY